MNTVIDGVVDIAKGNVSAVVDKVENALSQMVPILIGFIASVLNISGIGEKIRSIIHRSGSRSTRPSTSSSRPA